MASASRKPNEVPDPGSVKSTIEVSAKVKPVLYGTRVDIFLAILAGSLYADLEGGVVLAAAPVFDHGWAIC